MALQHLKFQNKVSKGKRFRIPFALLLVCISVLTACGSTKVNSDITSNGDSSVDTENNNVYSTQQSATEVKETQIETEDDIELSETFLTRCGSGESQILLAYDYMEDWEYTDYDEYEIYRRQVISDRQGAEITFWHYADMFTQHYGGAYDLQIASVDKVADCDFHMEMQGNEDNLGKFCVAKIKVYAIDDGLSDEGEQEFDGPTYYAVIPEDYLGETTFKGAGGIYEECSWNYYGGTYAVVAEAESGKFSETEEKEIIKFLSTFRQEYE